jgi:AcrR family transcriptional regulator
MFTAPMIVSAQQAQLLTRIENLFFRYGIKSITMDDVAAELGISKKTLYQWFESKDDLVVKVLEHHISREKSNCMQAASGAKNALEEIFILMDANSQELANMKSNIINDLQKYHRNAWEMMQKYHHEFTINIIRENITRGRKEGLYREDFDINIVAKLHLAAVFNLFDPQLFPDGTLSKAVLFKEYMMHYLHGITTPKGLTYLKKKLN